MSVQRGQQRSSNNQNNGSKKPTTIIIYPTVAPETVVVPIISCIFGFPILALLVICCLRRRAKLAREQAKRRRNHICDSENGRGRAVSLRSERTSMSRGYPSLELDTVFEEKFDNEPEGTVVEIMTPDAFEITTNLDEINEIR